MKVINYSSFGGSEVINLSQVALPAFGEHEVLIKISATTVNPIDIKIRKGTMQKMMPVALPFIPGSDFAGTVQSIGEKVTRFKAGDKVFGTNFGGTYAEYVVIKEDQAALMPANLSDNEAVSLAVPISTSNSLLIEYGQLQKGEKVLIHGAAGAVGSAMLQMAKALGAYVIGTASGKGVDQVRSLGADEAIDYKTQDFTKLVKDVDLVADLAGGETQAKSFEVLKKGGKLLSIVMPPSAELAVKYGVTAQFFSSRATFQKLEFGKQMIEAGKIKPGIAKVMKLEQAAQAQDLISNGGINGKIVLEIN